MNAEYNSGPRIAWWAWALLGVSFVLAIGVIWWASYIYAGDRVDADTNRIVSPNDPRPMPPPVAPFVAVSPRTARVPEDPNASSAKVRITPHVAEPAPQAVAPAKPPAPKPAPAASPPKPKDGPVRVAAASPAPRDMFPTGRIAPPPPKSTEASTGQGPQAAAPEDDESFPSFEYGEKTWRFTGKFVSSSQVDTTPTGQQVGDRPVHKLDSSVSSGRALFVQSEDDPGKLAVYR